MSSTFFKDLLLGPAASVAHDVETLRTAHNALVKDHRETHEALNRVVDCASSINGKSLEHTATLARHERTLTNVSSELESMKKIVVAITPGCDMAGYFKKLYR